MKPSIAVDMDEVIADALGEHLLRYNRDFAKDNPADELTLTDLHGRWLWDAVPPHRLRDLERYMLSDDFFRVLPVMPDAQRVLERLQTRYDVYIATAAMEVPSSFNAKFLWLGEHFPFIPTTNIVFCGSKSILRTDFLIDDNPRQLRLFEAKDATPSIGADSTSTNLLSRPEPAAFADAAERPAFGASTGAREGILFTSPANVNITGFRRVNNWQDVEKLFLS